ncbi:unnamed protein product [Effrenium voratum]|nr:unnamed protein product [Effrenium voratum]
MEAATIQGMRMPCAPPRLAPVPGRFLQPGEVRLRCGAHQAHRVSSPIQLRGMHTLVQPCRTPSPVRRLDLARAGDGSSPSPARLLRQMPSPGPSPFRSPSPVLRPPVSWQPPQRPVRTGLTMAARPLGGPVRMSPSQTQPPPFPWRVRQDSSPEQLSEIDISDRDVSSNAATAVSPQTPSERLVLRCEPCGPPPQRPVRSSQTLDRQAECDLREEMQRQVASKDQEISTLRSLVASTAEELDTARLRVTCIVCADADIQCIFQPCHHVVCCQECAGQCRMCPVCRSSVQTASAVYLP